MTMEFDLRLLEIRISIGRSTRQKGRSGLWWSLVAYMANLREVEAKGVVQQEVMWRQEEVSVMDSILIPGHETIFPNKHMILYILTYCKLNKALISTVKLMLAKTVLLWNKWVLKKYLTQRSSISVATTITHIE